MCLAAAEIFHTDGHDEASGRFAQFCEAPENYQPTLRYNPKY
jgi:hypothetical protein